INMPITLLARQFGDSVLWNPGTYLNTQTSYTPVFKGPIDQLYNIQIKTNTGCVTVDTLLVKTIEKVQVYVPTAFTPNHDGKNDLLRPVLMEIKDLRYFRIFNRWGQLMFETKTDRAGWDGTYKGTPQSTQVFVWEMQGIGVDGVTYMQKGSSLLIR
ncbi:MAG TPA: T9SS type B sorting domain-containing protein, partial [Chitinophagaceae bacterium]|nr:T9SS type B sorting domain-containing protein [Chitinophagaceae bacterium]